MNKPLRRFLTVFAFALILGLCGCSSYYYASSLNRVDSYKGAHKARFYIKGVKLEGAALGGAIHYSDYYSAVNLNDMLRSQYPSMFSNGRDAIPLEVDISISDSYNSTHIAAYFTMGIAPGKDRYYHDVRVMVTIDDPEFSQLLNENVEYRTVAIFKSSTLLPLGVIPPSSSGIRFEIHDQIKGWGSPSLSESSAFFRMQLVGAIVEAIQSSDVDSLDILYGKWQEIREARMRKLMEKIN